MVGLTITACKPSPIPRHTSISARYLLLPYSLLFVVSLQFIDSFTALLFFVLPIADTELTNNNFLTQAFTAVFTTLAVPSTLVLNNSFFLFGLNETIAAQ